MKQMTAMWAARKMVKRGVSLQFKRDDMADIIPAIQNYARQVFHELLRIQHINSEFKEIKKRHISAFTFWQYSKLPRFVSDRLFYAISDQKKWACPDLIQWMALEIMGSLEDELKIVFQMLDANKDGKVSRDECVTVLSHAIANPLNHSYQSWQTEKSRIQKIIDQFFTQEGIQEADFEHYKTWYEQGMWELHDAVWDCITGALNSKEKVRNWMKLTQGPNPWEPEVEFSYLDSMPRSKSYREENFKDTYMALYQGKMYTETDGDCGPLRSAYYKLVNTELYRFTQRDDFKYKSLIYLGHGGCVVPFTPILETSKGERLYGLQLVSGQKVLKLYIRDELDYLNWKRALEGVTGSKSDILNQYKIEGDLGLGKSSFVKEGVCRKTGKKVAIKVIEKQNESKQIREEINVQRICKHPNLLQILDVYEDIENVYIVLELMEGPSLLDYCYEKREHESKIESNEMLGIILQLGQALQFLREYNILHRDVKAENVFLSGKQLQLKMKGKVVSVPEVKLGDFSLAQILCRDVTSGICGSITHLAPEIIKGEKYSYPADMFSLGVMIYQCATGSLPFFNLDLHKLQNQVKLEKPRILEEIMFKYPTVVYKMIYRLLIKRPYDRLRVNELLDLPDFKRMSIS